MSQFSGRQLRAIRRRQNLSREQLAVMAGVSLSALTRYEQDHAAPGLNAAASIAAALGTDVTSLLAETQQAAEARSISELPAWAQRLIHNLRADEGQAVSAA